MRVKYEGFACADCTMYLANGEELQQGPKIAALWTNEDQRNMCCTSTEETDLEFSWRQCDACGSALGGSRHAFVVLEEEPKSCAS
jgi:hypothetical protein